MKRAKVLAAVLLLGTGMATPVASAGAQATIGADLGLYSAYVWRGLSLTNRPVAQPAVYVTFPAGNASITLSGWATIDLGKYDDPNDHISQSGGESSFNLAEFDPLAEVSFPVGKATLTGGGVVYIYPNDAGFTEELNTVELYAKAAFEAPLSPEVSLYYDVDKIKGAYFEGGVTHSLPLNEKLSLDLGALGGLSLGQDVSTDPDEFANFFEDGPTHIDLSAGLPLTAGQISITPVFHFILGLDEFTKIASPSDQDQDVKIWFGATASWSRTLGEEPQP